MRGPFLLYLSAFKSRLALANLVTPLTSFAFQSREALTRRLEAQLKERVTLPVTEEHAHVWRYIDEKRLSGFGKRKRYSKFALSQEGTWIARDRDGASVPEVDLFQTDVWLADPRAISTVGAPTHENAREAIEFCYQLNLLSRSKHTRTAAAQAQMGLNEVAGRGNNPLVLGPEAAVLLRQVLEADVLILRGLLREAISGPEEFSRNDMSLKFDSIVKSALVAARQLQPQSDLSVVREFARSVRGAMDRAKGTRASGMIEHRVVPRLEWLTDLGVLSKQGLARNEQRYIVTEDANLLFGLLNESVVSSDDVASNYWHRSARFRRLCGSLASHPPREALRIGYGIMKRPVGPTPIREVSFVASLMCGDAISASGLAEQLIEWAATENDITVSGGRFKRSPEMVHFRK